MRKKSDNFKADVKEDEDNILSELKLIRFEAYYDKKMSLEEVNLEMRKLIDMKTNIQQTNEKQSNTKFIRQTVNSNVIPDYAYPFKHDKMTCNIF